MRVSFHDGWTCRRVGEDGPGKPVVLPHDAMLAERRIPESAGSINTGFFDAQDYEYTKEFIAPANAAYIEFEGVYHHAEVYLDGHVLPAHPNGYFGFQVPVTKGAHTLRVIAHNSDQPNSRWYSGTGIYRPVWLVCLPKIHF